ncbi:plasmalemma vesicle associated protein b [Myripristis murdjan]|uniref:Plasmalemma vesicle associated protein b n=1 Tax=Myripristis murdjan TaxID=586833 RepID=A0A667XLZ1_9TELE|nr:plasmalemma vesicle-associated protein-like [Myripristis murdjan]
MYSSSYSRAKFGLDAREPLHKPKGKSCGYYMRIVFFFSSLIQSLIIISLVLFLIYGQPEKTAEEKRVKELELNFNKLSENNIKLRKEKGELGAQLGARTAEKAALEKELEKVKTEANTTVTQLQQKIIQCEADKRLALTRSTPVVHCPTTPIQPPVVVTTGSEIKTLQSLNAQQRAMISLIEANFTQTVHYLSQERDNALKDRDAHHQDAITLRRDNSVLNEQLTTYTRKCKEDFARSLEGIQTVTSSFLTRINSLFPHQLTFHLTCEKQQEQMDKIRTSCTNLSKDVEDKFQKYLDNVGNKVADIQAQSSRLEVQTSHLTADLKQCRLNSSLTVAEASRQLQLKQQKHDNQMEDLLRVQNRLREEKKLQSDRLAVRESELQNLKAKIQTLTAQASCKPGVPKPAALQVAPYQSKQTGTSWPFVGAPGIRKTPTVR